MQCCKQITIGKKNSGGTKAWVEANTKYFEGWFICAIECFTSELAIVLPVAIIIIIVK